jgi:hypothetical protein
LDRKLLERAQMPSHPTHPADRHRAPSTLPSGPVLADLLKRAGDQAGYARWAEQVQAAGYCARPVRLRGGIDHADTATGELHKHHTTDHEPDGVLLKACGSRRAARCPSCSAVYRYDAYHLIAAGLRGGKGMPETVANHPTVFATFTAPSFGMVHTRREQGGTVYPCHAGRLGGHCPHGRRLACWHRHEDGDPALGLPLCADCYDYAAAVVWNATAPELWRRTTIYLTRALARRLGLSRAEFARTVRVSYAKVAEFQRRGAVHYHAVLRVDGRGPDGEVTGSPVGLSVEVLCDAIREVAANVAVPVPTAAGGTASARWGGQLDLRIIASTEAAGVLSAERVARYVAKYATKAAEAVGPDLDRPITSAAEIDLRDLGEHAARLVRACWTLGGRADLAGLGLRRWAHMLGYRGHFLTRSRRYSTTFRALRGARRAWASQHRYGPGAVLDRDGWPALPERTLVLSSLAYAGTGYTTAGDAWLAWSMGESARDMRRVAREELGAVA